jgi:hypothetical protein
VVFFFFLIFGSSCFAPGDASYSFAEENKMPDSGVTAPPGEQSKVVQATGSQFGGSG